MESNAMKKIYFAFLCAACAFTLFSCQKENNGPEESPVPDGYIRMTLKAVSDETKTTVDGEGNVKWAEGDQIKVYFNKPEAVDFTLVGNGGSAYGDFTGDAPGGYTALYAVYPTARYSSVSSSTVYVTIPATQAAVFGQANIAVAKVDGETGHMAFKNVNAFVGFTVPEGANKVVVSSVGGENLSGTLAVDCSGDVPAVDALSSGGSSITVNFPNAEGGTYYVAVAPGVTHSKGLLLTWKNGDTVTGTYWLNKAVTTVSGEIIEMETVSTDGNYYVSVNGVGKKNGMNADNAWSAAQFWSKLHPGGTDTQMDGAKLANIDGATFHLAEGTYNWGTGAEININESETISFTIKGESGTIFTGDDDNDGTGDHRILFINGNLNITFDGITFTKGKTTGSGDARFGGGVFIRSGSHSFIDCAFNDNSAQYGGAIRFESEEGELTLTRTSFSNNTASSDAGALSLAKGTTNITDCDFLSNSASSLGGAIDCCGSAVVNISGGSFDGNRSDSGDGGAIVVEENSKMEVLQSVIKNNHAHDRGGAISVIGNSSLKVFNSYFKQNEASTGGAVYTTKQTIKKKDYHPDFYVSGCSFEGNHITNHIGCTFNIDAVNNFVMYNSSVRNSYTQNSDEQTSVNPCWVAIDGVKASACIANSSIIGDTWLGGQKPKTNDKALTDGTALVVIWENTKTIYFINCIIVPETSNDIKAIRGFDDSKQAIIERFYTHSGGFGDYISTNSDVEGNSVDLKISDFGGMEDGWSNNCWTWNGKISSSTPTMATQSAVYNRVNGICSDFVNWPALNFNNDQLGTSRGNGDWWPGAYQPSN